jgi:ribosomal protein S18 acetylase RimI-like enzyme
MAGVGHERIRHMTTMLKVAGPGDIASVADLAHEIWNRHYIPLIGKEQVDYMLAKFQSAPAIRGQIDSGYEYYMVMDRGRQAGYFALVPCPEAASAQLSKIYVRQEQRGCGFGRAVIAFAQERCIEMGIHELWLTVNRHNAGSIAFYERMGFTKTGAVVQDIGNDFVMDDYKMVKTI